MYVCMYDNELQYYVGAKFHCMYAFTDAMATREFSSVMLSIISL